MSTAVFTFTPEFGLQEDVEFLTLVFQADSGKEKRPSALADDTALAATLWQKSAEWTGLPA